MTYLAPKHALPPFTHAFQPIVDVNAREPYAHEALIRGTDGKGAFSVLSGLDSDALYELDRKGHAQAVVLAARIGMTSRLSVNALPRSFSRNNHADRLRAVALDAKFALNRIIVEVTENEAIADLGSFVESIASYRRLGVQIALDDFGAGHSGLNLLADFQPDLLKLDMNLVRSIASRGPRQAIVRAILQVCEDLAIDVIAEGIETVDEYRWFRDLGVQLFQGYLFAAPAFEAMPAANFPSYSPNGAEPCNRV